MTSYQEVFERKEVKYRLDAAQRSAMLTALEGRMAVDDYGTTSIVSRYFDTPDRALIERSLDKPLYKEKLRVRSYGIPGEDDQVRRAQEEVPGHRVQAPCRLLVCGGAGVYGRHAL